MKLQLVSDLHLESRPFTLKVHPKADVLVLAGDIASYRARPRFANLLKALPKTLPTLFLYGNHEFYDDHMEDTKKEVEALALALRHSQLRILDDSHIIIYGYLFVGSTLWSDFALSGDVKKSMEYARRGINDFSCIGFDKKLFTPEIAAEMHRRSKMFIRKSLSLYPEFPTVIVTHFLPSARSVHKQFAGSLLNPYFASDCENLMGGQVKLFLHGHTHSSCDYVVNGTRVVCNPRGYTEAENPEFNSQLLIEI